MGVVYSKLLEVYFYVIGIVSSSEYYNRGAILEEAANKLMNRCQRRQTMKEEYSGRERLFLNDAPPL